MATFVWRQNGFKNNKQSFCIYKKITHGLSTETGTPCVYLLLWDQHMYDACMYNTAPPSISTADISTSSLFEHCAPFIFQRREQCKYLYEIASQVRAFVTTMFINISYIVPVFISCIILSPHNIQPPSFLEHIHWALQIAAVAPNFTFFF